VRLFALSDLRVERTLEGSFSDWGTPGVSTTLFSYLDSVSDEKVSVRSTRLGSWRPRERHNLLALFHLAGEYSGGNQTFSGPAFFF
jgi:hypothetical protein